MERDIYTVSRLNREARLLLESGFAGLWIEGEISNFARPSSGHWYFSLKDREAQLRCAMWRTRNALSGFTPAEGQMVLARGRISLYEARCEYQLIVEHIEAAGLGALKRAFEELKNRHQAEENAGALGWRLDDDEVARLDRAALPGIRSLANRVWQHG